MLNNIKLFVFDLGGTLMEYKGMHLSWVGYYKSSFEYVNEKLELGLSDQQIATSVQIFTDYNPAVNPREKEIDPEIIFGDIIKGWGTTIPPAKIIEVFFESLVGLRFEGAGILEYTGHIAALGEEFLPVILRRLGQ